MSVQDTYGYIKLAVAGQLVDMYFNEVVSMILDEADGADFGAAVVRASESEVSLGIGSFGILVKELTREADARGAGAVTKYLDNNAVAVLRKGHIWVELGGSTSVTAGTQVAALATGVICDTGEVSSTDIPGATFETDGAVGDIVQVRIA